MLIARWKYKVVLVSLFILVGYIAIIPVVSVSAANIPSCLSVDMYDPSPTEILLKYDNNGGFESQEIKVLVTVQGISDYNLSSQYRFAYYVEGSGIVQKGITFTKTTPETTPTATTQYQSNFTFPVDKPGIWYYTLEVTDGDQAVVGAAETCPASEQSKWRQFEIGSEAPNANQVISGYCSEITPIELTYNHYTCVRSTFDESWSVTETDCDPGYKPDTATCFNGLTPGGTPLSTTSCIPCVNESEQKTQLSHLSLCGEDDVSECDRSIPELSCSPVSRDDDPWKGHSRCLYTSQLLGANEICYRGANECNPFPDASYTQLYSCQPTDEVSEPYLGKCLPDVSSVHCEGTQIPHPTCVDAGFGPNAYCDPNVHVCREGEPEAPEPDPEAPIFDDTSTDFGVQNCPYTKPGANGQGALFDPQDGINPGTAEYDRQRAEHYQCVSCVAQGNSWTAIGCVDVSSPEGIFTTLIRLGIGTMGGVALLRMIWLGIVMGRSEDEGKIKEAWQGILSTLGGIAAVVFSVLLIRILAVNILNVVPPGFFGL